uniref:Growth-regulating factor n=1 Tax=Leersia perrieri TaxID=77586 RepID=A0A0D9VYJ8_9ORYZ
MELGGGVVMAAVDGGGGGGGELPGSRLLKHGRGNAGDQEHGWRPPPAKQARSSGGDAAAAAVSEAVKVAAPFLLGASCSPGHGGEQMLSFSSSAASACASGGGGGGAAAAGGAMPLYYGTPASCSGLSSVSLSSSMQGAMARVRGPFTPSQWIELEHQALIYKYLAANSPVPHSLLIPIRRSLTSPYSPVYFGSSTLGWGSFQLGYSGNTDPEPGRCRRTDGKKWRCSRDAVADQKYCERHMNRGRHRSRKHVEGQPGHAAKAMPAAVAAAAASATQPSAPAAHGGGAAAGLAVNHQQQQMKNYAVNTANPCSLQYSRELVNKHNENEQVQDSGSLSMLTSMNTRNTGSLFPFSKQQHNPFEVSNSRSDFGLVSPDSLMSSPHSSLENVNMLTSQSLNEHQSSVSLQHFVDWPRTPAQGALAWPDAEDMQAQRSQLSISAPMASSDLSSASTSPIHEKLMLSPLKLSREYSPIGLGAIANRDEVNQGEANWMPMFRDSLMGGPLGEVLNKNNNMEASNCLSASLNLLNDGWDSSSGFDSSPVGVLQKTTFGSVSSSTGSSPRLENHSVYDGISNLRDDLGSIVVNHPSIRLV